ncbi:MAG: CvpA family protein [Rhodospirillaceae bacterium]
MNAVDIGVVAVIGLSALLALMRGFVSEVLSVGGWVGAALATLYGFPRVQPYMRAHVEPAILADGMAILGIFVLSLVIFSVIAHEISKGVRNSSLGAIDRSLGLLFGLARGALLVCLAWMVVSWLMPDREKDQPVWLREAKARPLAETGAAWLQSMVPAQMRNDAKVQAEMLKTKAQQTMQDAEALHRLSTGKPEAAPTPPGQSPATAPAPGSATAPAPDSRKKREPDEVGRLIRNAN